jgi:hypothetical protein
VFFLPCVLRGREHKHLKRIYNLRESRQGQRNDITSRKSLHEVDEKLRPSESSAKKIGVSRPTADRAEKVVDAIDKLKAEGDAPSAEDLRKTPRAHLQFCLRSGRRWRSDIAFSPFGEKAEKNDCAGSP